MHAASRLCQYFEHDDGSLPELELAYSDLAASVAAFNLLFSHSRFDFATGRATVYSIQDNAEVSFPGGDAASQVVAGTIEPFHVLLPELTVEARTIPDLGVFFSQGRIVIDYRMGPSWAAQEIQDFMLLLSHCVALGGDLSVPWWGPAGEAEFRSAIAARSSEDELANQSIEGTNNGGTSYGSFPRPVPPSFAPHVKRWAAS